MEAERGRCVYKPEDPEECRSHPAAQPQKGPTCRHRDPRPQPPEPRPQSLCRRPRARRPVTGSTGNAAPGGLVLRSVNLS